MTESDEETKEHPLYEQPAAAAPDLTPAGGPPPPTSFPGDPLQPTTSVGAVPPMPPAMAPFNAGTNPQAPTYPAAPPAYPQPPNSGWPGQQYPAQPQPWQQPGYGAQAGYGQPAYGTAPGYAPAAQQPRGAPTYRSSFLVVLAGLVLIIFGVAVAVLGAWTLTLGSDFSRFIRDNDIAIFGRQIDRDTLKAVVQPMPGILMVLGVLQLLVGAVILAHRSWARWLGVLLALVGLVVGVFALIAVVQLVTGVSLQLMIASIVLVGYAFVLLALIAGGGHFTARYPRAR